MSIPTFAPGRNPSFVVPVETDFPHTRQVPIDPAGTHVIAHTLRGVDVVRLLYNGCVEDEKDYIESFFHHHLGPANQFYWLPPNKVASPLDAAPELDVVTVGGAPASQRTYKVQYTWWDPTSEEETKPSPEGSQTVESGDCLTVTVPHFPNAVGAWRVYAGESTPELQASVTTRTWTEPVGGMNTGTGGPPSANTLHPAKLYGLLGKVQKTYRSFGRWDLAFEVVEEWFNG